ncbi:MAG: hypothetical protein R2839_12790, partial [Thermomicrobiales bacterium]
MNHHLHRSTNAISLRRFVSIAAVFALLLPLLAACGGDGSPSRTGKVTWYQGVPPSDVSAAAPQVSTDNAQTQPSQAATEPTPTVATVAPTPTSAPAQTSEPPVTGKLLTDEELAQYQPNELGYVPVLMYHNIVLEYDEIAVQGDVLYRTADELRSDLQWLYDN